MHVIRHSKSVNESEVVVARHIRKYFFPRHFFPFQEFYSLEHLRVTQCHVDVENSHVIIMIACACPRASCLCIECAEKNCVAIVCSSYFVRFLANHNFSNLSTQSRLIKSEMHCIGIMMCGTSPSKFYLPDERVRMRLNAVKMHLIGWDAVMFVRRNSIR